MKYPWEQYPHIWRNKTAFMNYLRGCLRKAWSKNPVKHEYIKKMRYKIPNPNPKGRAKTVFGFKCEMCKEEYLIKDCQVDHITPAGKLNEVEDIQGFTERLLFVTEDDLRLVCKGCNSALAMADRYGITYGEAIIRKRVIEKSKLPVEKQKKILTSHSLPCHNAEARKESWRKYIEQEL